MTFPERCAPLAHFVACLRLATFAGLIFFTGCKVKSAQIADESSTEVKQSTALNNEILKRHRFQSITPTGARIFRSSLSWQKGQLKEPRYPQLWQCANNVSRVLEDAGLRSYSSPLLKTMVRKVSARNGHVTRLPKDKPGIIKALNRIYGGYLPTGALVSGCLHADCSGHASEGHISIIGDEDSAGNLQLYHNNWYRPDSFKPPLRKPFVITPEVFEKGFKRQWMPTPWLSFVRNEKGEITDFTSVVPDIDDLDPLQYFVTVSIPKEILDEAKVSKTTDGQGGMSNTKSTLVEETRDANSAEECPSLTVTDEDPKGANVRSEPNGRIIGQVKFGTELTKLAASGDWIKVTTPLGAGYVSRELVSETCDCRDFKVVDPDPAGANLRAAPDMRSAVIQSLSTDTSVTRLGEANEGRWTKVKYQEKTGFVATSLIAPACGLER